MFLLLLFVSVFAIQESAWGAPHPNIVSMIADREKERDDFSKSAASSHLKASKDSLPPLEVPPKWEVIEEHPDYPTDDAVVAALRVTDPRLRPALPKHPETEDCTATFQAAIDQVRAAGGGTVFVPEGEYLFRGNLRLPQHVTLRGRWQAPRAVGWKAGSVLKIAPAETGSDGAPFLTIETSTGVQDLSFYYPDQRPDAVRPYPFTIRAEGTNTLQNLTFVNAYRGLEANAAMSVFRGLYGTPLETGVIAGNGVALPRFEVIEFSPRPWAWWPLDDVAPNPDKKGNYARFMLDEGVAIRLREMDGFAWFHADISGYSCGLITEDDEGLAKDEGSAPHGVGFDVNIHGCRTAMRIRRGGVTWHGARFEGLATGVESSEHGNAILHDCKVVGGEKAIDLAATSSTNLEMVHCGIGGEVSVRGSNRFTLRDCDLSGGAMAAASFSEQARIRLMGCRSEGQPVKVPERKNLVIDQGRSAASEFPKVLMDYRRDWNARRKPSRLELFNVTDARFQGGAKGDKKSDDTAAIRAAIRAANNSGGGIVFLPPGYYRVTGNLDLGSGVELRGAAGARYTAGAGVSGSTEHLMSVLMVEAKGPSDGEPFLTLGDGSGLRGLLIFYPGQNWKRVLVDGDGFREFPFTVRAKGKGNYIISCSAPNPYQFADFHGARDFLVEFCLTGGIRTVYRVGGGSVGGRIQTGHIKPSGFMGTLTDVKNIATSRGHYGQLTAPILDAFELNDCTDITLAGIFARTAHRVLTVNGASGRAVMIGGEQLQNGFVFQKQGDGSFPLIECGMNAGSHGDDTGKAAILLEEGFKGAAICHGGHFGGTADHIYRILSGRLSVADATTPNYGYRSPRAIEVGPTGKLDLHRAGISSDWTFTVAKGGQVRMDACEFPAGVPVGKIEGQVEINAIETPGALIISAPGQQQFDEQGLVLDRTGTKRMEDERSWAQLLESGDSFKLDVRDPGFTDGKAPEVTIRFMLFTQAPCEVGVAIDGENGLQRVPVAGKSMTRSLGPGFHSMEVKVRGARFGSDTADIVMTLTKGTTAQVRPALTMTSVLKNTPIPSMR